MKCTRCEKDLSIAIITPKGYVCGECQMHANPFVMELIRYRSRLSLYNKTNDYVENVMTLDQFQNCGWFLRQKIERRGFVTYILEYHGKVKCSRCVGYDWPATIINKCKLYQMCSWRKNRLADGRKIDTRTRNGLPV